MKFLIVLALTLMALESLAEKATKGRKSYIFPSNSKFRQIDIEQLLQNQNGYKQDENMAENIKVEPMVSGPAAVALKPDSSSGRLFFKKFFLMGKQPQKPQFIIITQPSSPAPIPPTTPLTSPSEEFLVDFTGTVTTSPADDARGGDALGDDVADDDDDSDNGYEDEVEEEQYNAKKNQPTTYKLVKGTGNQRGISFVVPSKYMRNFQAKRNSIAVNPSAMYNSAGASKVKKFLVNNNANGNVKRKRSKRPVRRFTVAQG